MYLVSENGSTPGLDLEPVDAEHVSGLSDEAVNRLWLRWLDLYDLELDRSEKGLSFWKEVWHVEFPAGPKTATE
jgi:hypothetical protein